MSIIDPIDKTWHKVYRPTVFQEIAPCRLTSTLPPDRYDEPWGAPEYYPNESRFYPSRGVLETATFVNPCSEEIPPDAIGVVARFTVTPRDGDGEVRVDPTDATSANAATVLKFKKKQVLMFEAGVLLSADGTFDVATWHAGADVMIDVLGYLLPDPTPAGGAKGDKGDTGSAGLQGERGETGAQGATGAKGDNGDTGTAGLQGERGEAGAQGPAGAIGAKGEPGAAGNQGERGETGAQGPAGARGLTGATGATGATGPMGPAGAPGRDGVSNLTVVKGHGCYPPGNNANSPLVVSDASVTPSSIVILNYTDAGSNGNALALTGQAVGYFATSGSPNKCFQYVVINKAP